MGGARLDELIFYNIIVSRSCIDPR